MGLSLVKNKVSFRGQAIRIELKGNLHDYHHDWAQAGHFLVDLCAASRGGIGLFSVNTRLINKMTR